MARPEIFLPEEILLSIVRSVPCLPLPAQPPKEPFDETSDGYSPGSEETELQIREPDVVRSNFRALARLAMVSKQLQRLAEPLLYQGFPGHRVCSARLWLTAILAKPERAQHVRHITVNEFGTLGGAASTGLFTSRLREPGYTISPFDAIQIMTIDRNAMDTEERTWELADSGELDERIIPQIKRLVRDAELPESTRTWFRNSLRHNTSLDQMYSLMVLACPNLTSLDMWVCGRSKQPVLSVVLASPAGAIPRVGVFRNGVQIDDWETAFLGEAIDGGISVFANGQFRRPEVRAIHAVNQNSLGINRLDLPITGLHDGDEMIDLWPNKWPGIRHVCLQNCESNLCFLLDLFKTCPSLVSLELISDPGKELVDLQGHHAVFEHLGGRLQRLVYDARGTVSTSDRLESLQCLTNLKTLAITPSIMLGRSTDDNEEDQKHLVDLIPRSGSLQSLTLLRSGSVDIEEEVKLVKQDPSFAQLKIEVCQT